MELLDVWMYIIDIALYNNIYSILLYHLILTYSCMYVSCIVLVD